MFETFKLTEKIKETDEITKKDIEHYWEKVKENHQCTSHNYILVTTSYNPWMMTSVKHTQ